MNIQQLKKEIEQIEKERQEIFDKKKHLDEKLNNLYNKLQKTKNMLDQELMKQAVSFEDKVKFLLTESNDGGFAKYNEAERFFRDMGFSCSGYFPKTGQRALQIAFIRDDKEQFNKILDSVQKILPYINPLDGEKIINLLEKDLSLYGSYSIRVDDKFHIFRNDFKINTFNTLEECLKYAQENYYYKKLGED